MAKKYTTQFADYALIGIATTGTTDYTLIGELTDVNFNLSITEISTVSHETGKYDDFDLGRITWDISYSSYIPYSSQNIYDLLEEVKTDPYRAVKVYHSDEETGDKYITGEVGITSLSAAWSGNDSKATGSGSLKGRGEYNIETVA